MFATTLVKLSEQEYELRVNNDVSNATHTWLVNRNCQVKKSVYDGFTGFRFITIPAKLLETLIERYPVASNDNSAPFEEYLKNKVEELQKAQDWAQVLFITEGWTTTFKKDAWKQLSPTQRERIEALKLQDVISKLEKSQLRKIVTLLKEVSLIGKEFKLANKNEEELLNVITELFPHKKTEVESALTLVKAMN
jgi:hypothetical protein